jgi:hypothetical protein
LKNQSKAGCPPVPEFVYRLSVPIRSNGSIDDVRVYNRVLTESEITAVYRAGVR